MNILMCNDTENQFNHVMKDGLTLGSDFEVISKRMWQILTKCFAEQSCSSICPLVRSFERIGLGMRTQIEYFYQKVSKKIVLTV